MKKAKQIWAYSVGHMLVRNYVEIFYKIFFRRMTTIGEDNIPKGEPVIFVVNHQNALIDPLALIYTFRGRPIFMARADIFKNPIAAKILRLFKIVPIFRIRDGIKNLQNNDESFRIVVDALKAKQRLIILPEGNHFGQKRLRSLKKGVARIAFQAEEELDFNLNIKMLPVGLDYTDYIKFGSKILIQFGKPFEITKYKDTYLENNQKGMNELMKEIREQMIPLMLHIDDAEDYDSIKSLTDLLLLKKVSDKSIPNNHKSKLDFSQITANKIIEIKENEIGLFNELKENAASFNNQVSKLKLRPWVMLKEKYSLPAILVNLLLQLALLPLFLYGFIANILPFQLPVILSRGVKDPQFLSSFRLAISVFAFTFIYIAYIVILSFIISNNLIIIALMCSFPLIGYFSFIYYKWNKKTVARWRNNGLRAKKDLTYTTMRENWNEIIRVLESKVSN